MQEQTKILESVLNELVYLGLVDNQKDMALKLGLTEPYFSLVINGKKNLSEKIITKMKTNFRLNANYLRGESDQMFEVGGSRSVPDIGNKDKYLRLLEEVAEERKRSNASVFEKLNEIVIVQRENSTSIINKIQEMHSHQREFANETNFNSRAMLEEYSAILDRVIGIEIVLGSLGTALKNIQNSLSVERKGKA